MFVLHVIICLLLCNLTFLPEPPPPKKKKFILTFFFSFEFAAADDCAEGEYLSGECTGSSNPTCTPCTASCPDGFFLDGTCGVSALAMCFLPQTCVFATCHWFAKAFRSFQGVFNLQ